MPALGLGTIRHLRRHPMSAGLHLGFVYIFCGQQRRDLLPYVRLSPNPPTYE